MPDQLKYGRIEWERRFLLATAPDLTKAERTYLIEDRYLPNTRLRLRQMKGQGEVAYKLARKLPAHRIGGGVMGNLYLDQREFALLAALHDGVLRKRRYYLGDWGVDVFEGTLDGLVLAEAEAPDEQALSLLRPPFPVVAEVTEDPYFRGANLATSDSESLRTNLARFGLSLQDQPG